MLQRYQNLKKPFLPYAHFKNKYYIHKNFQLDNGYMSQKMGMLSDRPLAHFSGARTISRKSKLSWQRTEHDLNNGNRNVGYLTCVKPYLERVTPSSITKNSDILAYLHIVYKYIQSKGQKRQQQDNEKHTIARVFWHFSPLFL